METRTEPSGTPQLRRKIGRYAIFGEIASGGMATVYFGRQAGAVGFSRSVAIKQLHAQFARSPEFVAQFLDEARLTARIRHPNVVAVLDVVAREGELFVIMEYVQGEPLSRLMRFAREPIPIPVACAILVQVLLGLHAAHEATTEHGEPLEIVHRDVSPQNVLVGVDGSSHVLDFGVAKAASQIHNTADGQIKGKITYMAPEQLSGLELDRRADIFAAAVILWEMLTGQRLFAKGDPGATIAAVLSGAVRPPGSIRPDVSPALDALVMRALAANPGDRFATAREMAGSLEACVPLASAMKVGAWVEGVAGTSLKDRAQLLREVEESSSVKIILDPEALGRRLSAVRPSTPPVDSERTHREKPVSKPSAAAGTGLLRPLRLRSRTWGIALIATLFLTAVLALASQRGRVAPAVAASATGARAEPTPVASALATLRPSVVTGAQVTEASDLPLEQPAVRDVQPTTATRPVKKPSRNAGHQTSNCTPPWVHDAQGRKYFKPECF